MHQPATRASSRQRPLTVTILAILAAVGGVGAVLGIVVGAVIHGPGSLDEIEAIMVLGALAMSALYVAFAYGAWKLRSWGWALGIVAGAASIVLTTAVLVRGWADLMVDAPPLAVVALLVIVIAAVSLFFWFRPEVKAAFERG